MRSLAHWPVLSFQGDASSALGMSSRTRCFWDLHLELNEMKAAGFCTARSNSVTQRCTCLTTQPCKRSLQESKGQTGICGGRGFAAVRGFRRSQQVTSSSPLPHPHSVMHRWIYWWTSHWQKRTGQKERGKTKESCSPRAAVNVWKSSLPIPAIKPKRRQARAHESASDRIIEFQHHGDRFHLNQRPTFCVAAMTKSTRQDVNYWLGFIIGYLPEPTSPKVMATLQG